MIWWAILIVIIKASATWWHTESEVVHWTEQREMDKSFPEATVFIDFVLF